MERHLPAWTARALAALSVGLLAALAVGLLAALAVGLLAASSGGIAHAAGSYYGYPYDYGHRGEAFALRKDMARMRDQMRLQQRQLQEQIRLQHEQIRLLREQVAAQRRVTGMQACYYRLTAGIETCDDLFEPETTEHARCQSSVLERNPGCASDVARPSPRSGG
jgi:hypothetical protein